MSMGKNAWRGLKRLALREQRAAGHAEDRRRGRESHPAGKSEWAAITPQRPVHTKRAVARHRELAKSLKAQRAS